jgi:hypothetical protein
MCNLYSITTNQAAILALRDRAGQGVDRAKEAIGSRAEDEGVGGGNNRATVTH